MNVAQIVYNSFVEFLSPNHCEACGKYLINNHHNNTILCLECLSTLVAPPTEAELMKRLLRHIQQDDLSISRFFALTSVAHNSPIMELIYSLKYRGLQRIGYYLGRELGATMLHLGFLDFDVIIPVPIHSARKRERGYNQAESICEGISDVVHIPVEVNSLYRIRYTRTQTQMNAYERKKNVSNVFGAGLKIKSIFEKKILLVDDVITTGSTLNSCATTLLELGAREIKVATLAVAV